MAVLKDVDNTSRADSRINAAAADAAPFWPEGWWRAVDSRIGVIPLPVFILLIFLVAGLLHLQQIKADSPTMIVILVLGGFTCAEIGKRLPIIRNVGGGAISATFIPSALTFYHVIPAPIEKAIVEFTKSTNFLYLFISTIIVGSIFAMDRGVLIKGFLKIFVPLSIGSVLAAAAGTAVGAGLGLDAKHTFFYLVVPIMAGGVGEGAIPLSIGYAALTGIPQGEIFAQVLPPVMLGSLTAILLSGMLNYVGKVFPSLTGEGRLQPGADEEGMQLSHEGEERDVGRIGASTIAAAGVTAITFYLLGIAVFSVTGLPAPVAMLFLAVFAKLSRAVSPQLQRGSMVVYEFVRTSMTYPLLFAIGVSLTPWDKLVAAFNPVNVFTIAATVFTIMATGFVVGRLMNMYPIETAIVNGCHSGQGGTGDVAILTAANRMELMPFAQISTRIGGAVTVTLALIVLGYLK